MPWVVVVNTPPGFPEGFGQAMAGKWIHVPEAVEGADVAVPATQLARVLHNGGECSMARTLLERDVETFTIPADCWEFVM